MFYHTTETYVKDNNILSLSSTTMILTYINVHDSFFLARQPPVGQGLLHEVSRSHKTTHQSRYDSSGRVISSSQRLLTTHDNHNRQTSTPPVGFEPTISAGERPQTYALDRAATGTYKRPHDTVCKQETLILS